MKKTSLLPNIKIKVGDIITLPPEQEDSYLSPENLLLVLKLEPDYYVKSTVMWKMTCWDFRRKRFYSGANPHFLNWIKVI